MEVRKTSARRMNRRKLQGTHGSSGGCERTGLMNRKIRRRRIGKEKGREKMAGSGAKNSLITRVSALSRRNARDQEKTSGEGKMGSRLHGGGAGTNA